MTSPYDVPAWQPSPNIDRSPTQEDYQRAIADLAAARRQLAELEKTVETERANQRRRFSKIQYDRDEARAEIRRLAEENSLTLQEYLETGRKWREARAECDRLKNGDFTRDEFQNLCHNLPDDCTPESFCDGCELYHHKLFLTSPITQLKCDLSAANRRIKSMGEECGRLKGELKRAWDVNRERLTEVWKLRCATNESLNTELATLRTKHAEAVALLRRWVDHSCLWELPVEIADNESMIEQTKAFLAAHEAEAKGGR